MKTYHLMFLRSNWCLVLEGSGEPETIFTNLPKADAVKHACERLEQSGGTLHIHVQSGRLQEKREIPKASVLVADVI